MKKSIKAFEVKVKANKIAKKDTKKIKGGNDPIGFEDGLITFIGIEEADIA